LPRKDEINKTINLSEYRFDERAPHTAEYVTPAVISECYRIGASSILDLGCGNGAMTRSLADRGFRVCGCDPSRQGIEIARRNNPSIRYEILSVYDDPARLGELFDAVVSTEVIEHLEKPRMLLRFAANALKPNGFLIISTPYHGYLKNLLLAATGKLDAHFTALWEGGHIKFFSRSTLTQLLKSEKFVVERFIGCGRLPYLWKSMILLSRKSN
jgi:2-polyprenyl-3-methyl-5-hydroxy-6-metoxy-1,4-benzoquinol methylase